MEQFVYQEGVYLGTPKFNQAKQKMEFIHEECSECKTEAQRRCQICGKILCLEHYSVILKDSSWIVGCSKCKEEVNKIIQFKGIDTSTAIEIIKRKEDEKAK